MWDNYDEIKDDEAKLNAKLLKKSRAMQKAEKAAGTTLASIEEESEVDLSSDGFKQLAAFLKKNDSECHYIPLIHALTLAASQTAVISKSEIEA
eukprot:COSAG02_NODE_6258_length_3697_cov_9.967482_2_plen_94_part_00